MCRWGDATTAGYKKPYIPRKRFDGSLDYYKALLRTIRIEQFIDEHILGISKEKYSAYIEELEGAGYIKSGTGRRNIRIYFDDKREQ